MPQKSKKAKVARKRNYTHKSRALPWASAEEVVADGPLKLDLFEAKVPFKFENPANPKTLAGDVKVPMFSVVPPASLIAQATAMRYGAYFAPRVDGSKGYGPYNWRDLPIEAHVYIDAALRHLAQWWDGDEVELVRDDEGRVIDEVNHLSFALATIGIIIDAKANQSLIDDRPRRKQASASIMLNDHKLPRYEK